MGVEPMVGRITADHRHLGLARYRISYRMREAPVSLIEVFMRVMQVRKMRDLHQRLQKKKRPPAGSQR